MSEVKLAAAACSMNKILSEKNSIHQFPELKIFQAGKDPVIKMNYALDLFLIPLPSRLEFISEDNVNLTNWRLGARPFWWLLPSYGIPLLWS